MSTERLRASRLEPLALVRWYVLIAGAGLLLEGGGLLLIDRLGLAASFGTSDARHNVLHVVWGIALLGVWSWARRRGAMPVIWAALVFGAFYVALGILGLTIDRPFGLLLGPGENIFHFTVGPLALVLAAWALKAVNDRSVVSLPVPIAAPVRRRRPSVERKRTPRRGRTRRH